MTHLRICLATRTEKNKCSPYDHEIQHLTQIIALHDSLIEMNHEERSGLQRHHSLNQQQSARIIVSLELYHC